MKLSFLFILLILKAIFFTNLTQTKAEFFAGIGYTNLGDRYNYSNLTVNQYVGIENGIPLNQYINLEFKRSSSFGMKSALSGSGIAANFGYKFNFNKFSYTPEIFANYSGGSVTDITMIPAQNILIFGFPIKIPEQVIPITYSMPVNIGMLNRFGYDFNNNFNVNLITGGTMTIFNIEQDSNKETVYKGRFIFGLGGEWKVNEKGNLRIYADYKYYIPLKKDIEREYPDAKNPGKTTKVKITNFGAETQAFELGVKYYF